MMFFRKALLSSAMKMCKGWTWYFWGITIKQLGVGIIWRKKDSKLKG